MENVLLATVPTAEAASALLGDLLLCSGEAGFTLEAATVLERDSSGRISVVGAATVEAMVGSIPLGAHAVVAVASESNPGLVDGLVAQHCGSIFRRPQPDLELEIARLEEEVLGRGQAARRER